MRAPSSASPARGVGVVDALETLVDGPCAPRRFGRIEEQLCLPARLGVQACTSRERSSGDRVGRAFVRACTRAGQGFCRRIVRSDRRRGQMPRPPVAVEIGKRIRECTMGGPSFLRTRLAVDRGACERVREGDPSQVEDNEACLFGGVEVGHVEPERGSGSRDDGELVHLARRGDEQHGPFALRKTFRSCGERTRDARRDGHGTGADRIDQAGGAGCELHEAERIARRRHVETFERGVVELITGKGGDELGRVGAREPTELQQVEIRAVQQRWLACASGDRTRRSGRRRAGGSRTEAQSALESSSQWRRRREPATGRSSAVAASRLSVAAPTAKRSPVGPGRSASARPSAAA